MISLKSVLIFLCIVQFSFAARVKVDVVNGKTLLRADNCKLLDEQVLAIEGWKQRIKDLGYTSSSPSCNCINHECRVDISGFLPKMIEDVNNKSPVLDGPNCWNASLVASKILPHFRYTTGEEMNFWMNSPLCERVGEDEPKLPGDVIAIRNDGEEYHGFIYLSDDIVFSKNGYHHSSKYQIQDIDRVYEIYGVDDKNCRHVSSSPIPIFSKLFGNCSSDRYAQFYRCKSWEEFKQSAKLDKKGLEILDGITDLECRIQDRSFSGVYDQNLINLAIINMNVIKDLAKSEINKIHHNQQTDVVLRRSDSDQDNADNLILWENIENRAIGVLGHISVNYGL